jgi:uncharacterized protein YecE (DUF72 family)
VQRICRSTVPPLISCIGTETFGGDASLSSMFKTLRTWARDIRKWKRQWRTVFVYFDNDQKSAAPIDALRLRKLIEKRT